MLQNKNLSVLGSNLLFKGIDETAFSTIFNSKNFRAEKEGELIFQAGEDSTWLYLILQGEVKLKYFRNRGINSSYRRVKNEFFGEQELLDKTKRISSAIADTDCIFYLISRDELFQLAGKHKTILSNLSLNDDTEIYDNDLSLSDSAESIVEKNEEIIMDEEPADISYENPADEELHDSHDENYLSFNENDNLNINNNGFDHGENHFELKSAEESMQNIFPNGNLNEILPELPEEHSDIFNSLSDNEELIPSIKDFDHIPEEPEKFEFTRSGSASPEKSYNDSFQTETLSLIEGTAKFINNNILFPLNEIKKHSAWLTNNHLPKEVIKVNELIVKQADSVQSLIDSAFAFLSGQNNINPQRQNISIIMNDILTLLSEYVEARNVKLYKKIDSDVVINVDKTQLYNAFFQITKNACDAMPDGGNIFVSLIGEAGNVKIEFIDEGPGIPSSLIFEVFEPLITHGKEDGVGLGLSIAKKIIQDHKGEIIIDGDLGEGTKVIITLPA